MDGFHIVSIKQGLLFDRSEEVFPTRAHGWRDDPPGLSLSAPNSSFFGFVASGTATLHVLEQDYTLVAGQYFSAAGELTISGGCGIVLERLGHRSLTQVGGPIETSGRLKYIDGCTDTLLIGPVRRGDACLNALFFPSGIDQTLHTHPSDRLGIVANGRGECRTVSRVIDLTPGDVFLIERDSIHGFHTDGRTGMTVIAYHPDSDFGPMDEDHPMINRTMVHGISAAVIEEIRTR